MWDEISLKNPLISLSIIVISIMIIVVFILFYIKVESFEDELDQIFRRTGGSSGSAVVNKIIDAAPIRGPQTRRYSYYKHWGGNAYPYPVREYFTGCYNPMINKGDGMDNYMDQLNYGGPGLYYGEETADKLGPTGIGSLMKGMDQRYYDCLKHSSAKDCSMNLEKYVNNNLQAQLYNP